LREEGRPRFAALRRGQTSWSRQWLRSVTSRSSAPCRPRSSPSTRSCYRRRFFGRADQVLARIDAISRGGIAALAARNGGPASPVEETLSASSGAPLEVLRLVILDGVMGIAGGCMARRTYFEVFITVPAE